MPEPRRVGVPAADAGEPPVCECCGLPKMWAKSAASRGGGYWRCRSKAREARREAMRRWRKANPERQREATRRWRERIRPRRHRLRGA